MRSERGQATVEWAGLVLLTSLALGALVSAMPFADGRSFGGFLSHRIVCAVRGSGCSDEELREAYGDRDAGLVRSHAPDIVYERGERSLPVDWRECRARDCSDAADDRDLDTHRTAAGARATAFTHVVQRGGRTYLQYWLYYPDSNSAVLGSDRIWNQSPLRLAGGYPGYHPDDWEGYAVRIDPDGTTSVRATSHGHWQWCKQRRCRGRWGRRTGWTRVSRGSHAGHVPQLRLRERTTTAEGIRLVPLETMDRTGYVPLEGGVTPPWRKRAWSDPESDAS